MFKHILIVLSHLALLGYSADWCYEHEECAPPHWYLHYPSCGLSSQSPINIITYNSVADSSLGPIIVEGSDATSEGELGNNGHSVEVTLKARYTLSGAGLTDAYTLAGFHAHFGNSDPALGGSEHQINGKAFPLEIHFVFYNSKYIDLTEAKKQSDGLAVIGVLFQIGSFNYALDHLLGQLSQVAYPGQKTSVRADLRKFLPARIGYYFKYNGSLTTPTCSENVTWLVAGNVQTISLSQYTQIVSSLYFSQPGAAEPLPMLDNFRPTQPLNGRTVSVYRK